MVHVIAPLGVFKHKHPPRSMLQLPFPPQPSKSLKLPEALRSSPYVPFGQLANAPFPDSSATVVPSGVVSSSSTSISIGWLILMGTSTSDTVPLHPLRGTESFAGEPKEKLTLGLERTLDRFEQVTASSNEEPSSRGVPASFTGEFDRHIEVIQCLVAGRLHDDGACTTM